MGGLDLQALFQNLAKNKNIDPTQFDPSMMQNMMAQMQQGGMSGMLDPHNKSATRVRLQQKLEHTQHTTSDTTTTLQPDCEIDRTPKKKKKKKKKILYNVIILPTKTCSRTQVITQVCSLMDTIMSVYEIKLRTNHPVPSKREMRDTLTSARDFPSNYTSHSQLAMLDRYAYLTGKKSELNPNYHSPSQINYLTKKNKQ